MPNPSQPPNPFAKDQAVIAERLKNVKHRLVVLSGKGGVGKSTVAVNLACALASRGKKVGLLDADFHGPTVPIMLGATGQAAPGTEGIEPVNTPWGVRAVSIGLFLPSDTNAVIWRGPMKMNAIKQLLSEVAWGELDYLIVDSPPGTGDEPLSLAQLLPDPDGAIIVTTPQEVALTAVRKSIRFCTQVGLKVLGIVENLAGYLCPHCNKISYPFGTGGGDKLARFAEAPLLASIPQADGVVAKADAGHPIVLDREHPVAKCYETLAEKIIDVLDA